LQLLHRADRDGEGPVVELPVEQLRAHRRLAMRRDLRPRRGEKPPHPVAIVAQRRLFQHRERQRQILAQHVPTLPPNIAKRHRTEPARHALDGLVDENCLDGLKIDHLNSDARRCRMGG
jgi:hypothetical protein